MKTVLFCSVLIVLSATVAHAADRPVADAPSDSAAYQLQAERQAALARLASNTVAVNNQARLVIRYASDAPVWTATACGYVNPHAIRYSARLAQLCADSNVAAR